MSNTPTPMAVAGAITKEMLDEAVQDELVSMMRNDPAKMVSVMLVMMGKMCVEANAETMDVKQELNVDITRYEVNASITIKKVNQ